jgi:hypothetical protein
MYRLRIPTRVILDGYGDGWWLVVASRDQMVARRVDVNKSGNHKSPWLNENRWGANRAPLQGRFSGPLSL